MRLPHDPGHLLYKAGLAIAVAVFAWAVVSDPIFRPSQSADLCGAANLRTCKVTDQGTWVAVTTPDGSVYLILLRNGKVIGVSKQ